MNRFFATHPVFAWVIALFIALAGAIGLVSLPVEQYPSIAPPALTMRITYPGADADTLDRNVTSIVEKEMNGVDGFQYMSATSRASPLTRSRCGPTLVALVTGPGTAPNGRPKATA